MATILIVDDVAANRTFLVTLLRPQGHRLLEAANGREGLAAVRTEHPDLVITDVLMPVMDGYEFVRQLRLEPATSRTPVLFCSAPYGAREARALALSSGQPYILTKPVEPEDVLKVVGRVLSGELASGMPPDTDSVATEFDRGYLRLLTDTLSENAEDLRAANARLRALINIGLELGSEQDSDRALQRVCSASRDLFGATYVTLGIVDLNDRTVQRVATCGTDAAHWIKTGDPVSGIFETVVAERRTLRGDNPGGDPAKPQFPLLHPEVHTFLAAPVVSSAHVYGWFCLVGNEGKAFTEDDEDLITALSGQIGRFYENGHFAAVAKRRTEELEREILERKYAQTAMHHERDRAQQYLDTADVFLLALDLEGRIVLVNRYACSVLGWSSDELIGRDWVETCLPARVRDVLRKTLHNVIGGSGAIVESPILTRSGEERTIEWRNTVLRDDAKLVVGTFSSGTDVTERNQAAEALRTSEERMRFALQHTNVGIWDMDYTTGVLRWSEILESHYGLRPGTFGGTFEAFIECVHPDDRESVLETVRKAMTAGADFSVQHRTLWPDGTVHWLSDTGRVILDGHGEPARAVGISQDVTQRRSLEAQYQQAQKMEAVGRLAGGVAHDFNNLLTVILGFCELLLADLDPDDPRQADMAEIQKAGVRAAGLTRQLLAFSRKQIIEPTLLDLQKVVAGMRSMLERLIGEDVEIVLSRRPELAPVMADCGQVEQIVMNLALNARDAMPRGGTLTIETTTVELDGHDAATHPAVASGPYVVLTVSDTGTGMTPEVQGHLFEPFFTTKEPGKGTGLGLATVHSIVTQSGGSVGVCSEVGKGTSFKVYFPRADATKMVVVDAPPPVARAHAGGETVLVVDDANGLLRLARRLLERQGYTVLVAANADEAVRLFEQHTSIDVLLTDVVMPGVSGPELTGRLVERRPALKVIYMSGYTEETIVHHGVLDPGIAFLHKPFTSDTLGRKIREVLDRPASVEGAERLQDAGSPADDAQQEPLPAWRE